MDRTTSIRALTVALSLLASLSPVPAADGNRLAHLDEPNNPWQFDRGSPQLITPQWVGEDGVDAVVVLAIDDMSGDGQRFRNYLTPIIERLKKIDGRGPVSITCNRPEPDHPNMQWFLEQGVSLEAHTMTHPCPLLQRGNFRRAKADYHNCVDLLAGIPNSRTVGFRFPCMDGQNTPSPRAYAELLGGVSDGGNFVESSTSVGVVFTPGDPDLPKSIFGDEGARRFAKYLMTGFVNYVEDYPYPFVVGGKIWELPFVYPNDYTGQALHGSQSPITIADFKAAVDATVAKRGATSLCFHSGGWMSSEQMADIVDHADRNHGKKVKFLNMREMVERIEKHMLGGHPLRNAEGGDNGVRVFDIDGDGYMDVLIANDKAKITRIWEPKKRAWRDVPFPTEIGQDLRFGIIDGKAVAVSMSHRIVRGGWRFTGDAWKTDPALVAGVDFEALKGNVRLRDIDGDGDCELINGSAIYRFTGGRWHALPFKLPPGTAIETAGGGDAGLRWADLDQDGRDDIIFSDGEGYGTWLFESLEKGWSRQGIDGKRGDEGELPPIVRADGSNNGAWVKRGHLYWQNEDTGVTKPHHIDLRSFGDLLGEQVNQPRSPGASLRAMEPRDGFTVELVAAEPLVMDPVDVAWGGDGRMWVCEMADYPIGIDNKDKPGARIAVLSDTTGDGVYDKRTLFADGLDYASTVLPWRDGVLIVAAPNIWFMRDTDDDGEADDKQVLYEGLGQGNEQHRSNGLAWGLDGWLYVANGDSGGTVRSTKTGASIALGGFDLRIKPDSGEIEPATGRTQHGRNRDDWGNWVAGHNSGAWQVALEDHDIRRNPRVTQPDARHSLFGVIDLYPASRVLSHWSGYRAPRAGQPGKLTSGCGYTFYRDSLFDGHIAPSMFMSAPVHNCIHRRDVTWDGVLMQSARADDEARSEFLRSADSWFRPTAIRTGPDGAMYVADMYRLVIEHPEWIDDTLEREMIADGRLRAGHDRGRIYKIFPKRTPLREPQALVGLEPDALATKIDSPNGWQRDTAHMMLTWLDEAQQKKAVSALQSIVRASAIPAARVQALSALADLGALAAEEVSTALDDKHPGVRRNALRVGEDLLDMKAVALLKDPDAHVQMQAAYALGSLDDPAVGRALAEFLVANADRPYLRAAGLASAHRFADEVLFDVLAEERTPTTAALTDALIDMFGEDDAVKFVPRVLERLAKREGDRYQTWQMTAATRLLERAGGNEQVQAIAQPMFADARGIVGDEGRSLEERRAAVGLLGSSNLKSATHLAPLLDIATPVELQVAAADALLRRDDAALAETILRRWSGYGAALRTALLDGCLSRPKLTGALLDVMADDRSLAASLDLPRRQLLLQSSDATVRERASNLLGAATRPDRAAVLERYAPALSNTGDRGDGRVVFAALCSTCHRLDGVGKVVGPDLAALSNRAPQAYLTAILDPNRAIESNWMQFVANTKDGRTLVGAVTEETSSAITLVGVDGSRTKVPRRDLESITSTGRSLMPEGLEASITVNQMTDLLAYLKVAGEPRKEFANNEPRLVNQADDPTVTLPAAAAEVYGPSIVFEQKYRNLGFWSNVADRAEWAFHLERAGEYELWVDLDNGSVGGRIRFTIGDQSVAAAVPGTGTWDDYRWGRAGILKLATGRHRLVANSDGALSAASLIDLRTIRLVPGGGDAPPKGTDWP